MQQGYQQENDRSDTIGSLAFRLRATPANPLPRPSRNSSAPQNLWFARSLARLLECKRCYAAFLSPEGDLLDQTSVGLPAPSPASEALARSISETFNGDGNFIYQSSTSPNGFARRLIGTRPVYGHHSVIGRVCTVSGDTAIFIAGWWQVQIPDAEFAIARRAIELLWDAVADLTKTTLQSHQMWLDDIESPALTIDENLIVRSMNSGFRRLVGEGVITLDGGTLSGSTPLITTQLRDAVRAAIIPDLNQKNVGSTVLISQEEQRFLFAVIGSIPGNTDPNLALIYIPQFNEEAGAQRIALAFGLSWVEARIVRCILRGRCPRAIGLELGFTEETVRTYIKRVMLKVGINRQSEFFVLHSRTFSPFKLRQPGAPYITTSSSM
ncbi:helix-turn-helix transcriptional regulator [Tardiphaga sp. 215_C5_N2_1]|uniref:helix-turn-helix transcriptional regulator n=1 Tax=Tardiphaga sp. 215_C5_N2_1 TaxID=3240774 RepID=UPI003F8C4AFB